jgi:competence protein ComEC
MMVAGGIWLCLWTRRWRLLGLAPLLAGAIAAAAAPAPDLLVTEDGKHLALVEGGVPLVLRERAGDYVRDLLAEASGFDGDPANLGSQPFSACSKDACVARIARGPAQWRLLATRSSTLIDWETFTRACAAADIVVSDRRLPRGCVPHWLKLDRPALERTGGLAIYLDGTPRIDMVVERVGAHPWNTTTDRAIVAAPR